MNDGSSERELLLVGNIVVGRDPICEISSDNTLLSRRHAEFVLRADDVVVRDLGSRNGVFVNGTKVAEGSLRGGDIVQIGHLQLRYVEDKAPLATLDAGHADPTGVVFAAVVADVAPPMSRPVQPIVVPEEDDDYTRVVPSPVPAAPGDSGGEDEYTRFVPSPARQADPRAARGEPEYAGAVPRPARVSPAAATVDDDEYTRLVRPLVPNQLQQRPSQASSVAGVAAKTQMIAPAPTADMKSQTVLATTLGALAADSPLAGSAGGRFARTARLTTGSWTTFVFGQLAVLAAVVFASVLLPLLARQGDALNGAGTTWLALSVVVVLVAVYMVGMRITRRTIQALTVLSEDVEYAAGGTLDAVGDPVGAQPVKDLANSVNRMVARLRGTADKHNRDGI